MTDKIDLYELLGVEKDDDIAVIKKAYKRLVMKYHPDRNLENPKAAEEAFKPIAEAWGVISDPVKRAEYDLTGSHTVVGAVEQEGEALFLMMLMGAITQNAFREKDYIDQVRAMLAGSMRDAEAGITALRVQANNITTLSEKFKPTKEGAHNPIEHSLREMAIEAGRRLLKLGLKRGDRVGVVAETTP